MHSTSTTSQHISQKMIIDCRTMDMTRSTSVIDSLMLWVTNAPQPSTMHFYLPSSLPGIRQLQCTLLSLGCAVTRVSNCVPC